jgi:hypothetical protein
MKMTTPSSTQVCLESLVLGALADAGYSSPQISRAGLEAPFYNPGRPEHAIEIRTDDALVWLYEDAAAFTVAGIGDRFERESFVSEQSYCSAFMSRLHEVISG